MARVIGDTREMSYAEWREERDSGDGVPRIGGSDAAAVLGVNRYKSRYRLWLEKSGKIEQPDIGHLDAVKAGNYLEDSVAQWVADEQGWKVQRRHQMFQHDTHDFMIANIDREIVGHEDGVGLLEIKTTNVRNRKDWTEDGEEKVPPEALVQVHHYCAVKNYDFCYVAALMGGQDLLLRRVDIDPELCEILIEREQEFVDMILNDTPPEMDESSAAVEWLMNKYPTFEYTEPVTLQGEELSEFHELVSRYDEARKMKEEAERLEGTAKNRLMELAADRKIITNGDRRVNIVETKYKRFDSKAFKDDNPELYNKYKTKEVHTRYPRVS